MAGTIKYATTARIVKFVGKKVLKLRETEWNGVGPELANKPTDTIPEQ